MAEPWELLFTRAVEQLQQGGIPKKDWIFGGGTVLTHKFNHRASKDVDIFFSDPQILGFVSPRVNDGVEANLLGYSEQANHTRLYFKEGEIDFILGSQISEMKPTFTKVLDSFVNVEHPVEIVAKKVHYRAAEFKPRDMFDLAVVFSSQRESILRNAGAFVEKLPILAQRIEDLERSGELESSFGELAILPGGEKIRGREVELCKQFVLGVEKKIEKGFTYNKNLGQGL